MRCKKKQVSMFLSKYGMASKKTGILGFRKYVAFEFKLEASCMKEQCPYKGMEMGNLVSSTIQLVS